MNCQVANLIDNLLYVFVRDTFSVHHKWRPCICTQVQVCMPMEKWESWSTLNDGHGCIHSKDLVVSHLYVTSSGKRGIPAQKFEIALRISFESGMLDAYVGENRTFVDPSVPALYA